MCKACKDRKNRLIARYFGRILISPIVATGVGIASNNVKHGLVTLLFMSAATIFFHVVDPPPDSSLL